MTPEAIEEKYQAYRQAIANHITGKIVPEHDEDGHKYRFVQSGKLVRSVTTKIIVDRPHLVPWAVKVAFEWMEQRWHTLNEMNREVLLKGAQMASGDVRDDAGGIGHLGHAAIEEYCLDWMASGKRPDDIRKYVDPASDPRVFAIARSAERLFKDKPQYKPLAVEILVGDETLNTAGTLDALVMNMENGEVELWDWKSSNHVHDTYAMQTAVYKELFQIMTSHHIDRLKIAHLSKDYDNPVLYVVPDMVGALEAYKAISKVYDYVNDGNAKLVKDYVQQDFNIEI
jgi:hypothetical protein